MPLAEHRLSPLLLGIECLVCVSCRCFEPCGSSNVISFEGCQRGGEIILGR